MIRKAVALFALLMVAFGVSACNTGERESSKAPLVETKPQTDIGGPSKATAGGPGELPPPDGFKKK